MYSIRIQYAQDKTRPDFLVNPHHIHEVTGETIVEVLSKFLIAIAQLQETLHDEKLAELRGSDDDIPF